METHKISGLYHCVSRSLLTLHDAYTYVPALKTLPLIIEHTGWPSRNNRKSSSKNRESGEYDSSYYLFLLGADPKHAGGIHTHGVPGWVVSESWVSEIQWWRKSLQSRFLADRPWCLLLVGAALKNLWECPQPPFSYIKTIIKNCVTINISTCCPKT